MDSVDPRAPEVLRFGCFQLDRRRRELLKNGRRVRLEGQPFVMLELLLERSNEVVTREDLRHKLWGSDTFVDFEHSINAAVKRLRQALDDSANTPRFIETIPRRGYRFIYPLSAPPDLALQSHLRWWSRLRAPLLASILIVLATLFVADNLGLRLNLFARKHAIRSLAVMPFQNLSPTAADEYLADGITDELTTELSQIPALTKVSSRSSAMAYKGTRKSASVLGRELGVDALVEGSVTRERERLRIEVQLIDAASDRHLWSARYDGAATSILDVQAQMAHRIAREIDATLSPRQEARLTKRSAVNPEAYDAYLKARYLHAKWSAGRGNLENAIKFYDRAIALQPDFAPAYAGKSLAEFFLAAALMEFKPPPDVIPSARAAAEKAMTIDPDSAEAYEVKGWYLQNHAWNMPAAEQAYRKAIELNPNYAPPYVWLGHVLDVAGRVAEAPPLIERARELDPLSPHIQWSAAEAYMLAGDLSKAQRECRELIELHADFWPAFTLLGNVYLWQRDYPRAIANMNRAVGISRRHPYTLGMLASAYALAGDRANARNIIAELNSIARAKYVAPPVMVRAYASLGDREHALQWMLKAYEQRCNETPRIPLWGPVVASLRGYQPYQDLLEKIKTRP